MTLSDEIVEETTKREIHEERMSEEDRLWYILQHGRHPPLQFLSFPKYDPNRPPGYRNYIAYVVTDKHKDEIDFEKYR